MEAVGEKIIKVHELWKDKDIFLKRKTGAIISLLIRINEYFRIMKSEMLVRTINLSLLMIEKIDDGEYEIPDQLYKSINNALSDVFNFEKISFFIHPEDEKIIKLYFSNFEENLDQIKIDYDNTLKRGECYLDYDFTKVHFKILQKTFDIRNIFLDYYRENQSNQPNRKKSKINDPVEKINDIDLKYFENGAFCEDNKIIDLIMKEDLKIVAALLIGFKPEKTAKILLKLPPELKNRVLYEIATIGHLSSQVINNIGKAAATIINGK